jgi:hypothetical protein
MKKLLAWLMFWKKKATHFEYYFDAALKDYKAKELFKKD